MFSNICNSIASQLTANGHTVSIAESSTGGLIAANLLSVSGASSYFKGGSVIYTRESRHAFLDLDLRKVKALEPLTEPMAAEFAHAARKKLDATCRYRGAWCRRSQGHSYGHAAGTSVIGISGPINATLMVETSIADREKNMHRFTEAALGLFSLTLLKYAENEPKL